MGPQDGYASVDGKRMPLDEGTVSITDRGFLYGDSMQELHAEVARTTADWHKNGGTGDAYVRYTYTRGDGSIDLYPAHGLHIITVKD